MNFETILNDSINVNVSNLESLKHSNSASADYLTNSTAADFMSKSLPTSPNQDEVSNIVNSNVTNNPYDTSLGLQSKAPTQDLLFRTRTISHAHHQPHDLALRMISDLNNGINLGNGINNMNSLVNKNEQSEEFNIFNNRYSNPNNNWPSFQWNNNFLKPRGSSTSFSLINKNINNNSSSTISNDNNGTTHIQISQINSTIPSNEEKENVNTTSTITTSTITTTVTSATSTADLINNISTSTTLTSTTSAVTTQDFKTTTTTTTSTTNGINIPSIFNPNSKPFSPMANDNKTEKSGIMHSDSNVTLINSHVVNSTANNVITSPNGITPQTPLINQFSKISLDSGSLTKSSPSSSIYNNIFFNESEQSNLFHGSPINNNNLSVPSQVLRHNSLPISSNTSMLISSERESDLSHLKNDIDLLIRSSELLFDGLIKYKDKLSNPNLSADTLNHIKKELLIPGWYQHTCYSINKIRDRLHEIFKLKQSVWMVDNDIYVTGDIDITLYYFKLHIHTCYDLKNCVASEWHSNHYTEISIWWASASLLFNQISLFFKLSETTMIKPLGKMHLEDKTNVIENEIKASKSVDENIFKMQAIGRKGSLLNHSTLVPHSTSISNLNSSSNITSPLATSSIVIDNEEVDNFNDELVLSESVLPVGITPSNSTIISAVPNTTPPTLPANSGKYPGTNIYIRGLPINTTDESLYNLCIRWGKIISSKAIVDMRTNECKGFGFVMYETEDEAKTALSELDNLGYHVSFAKSLTHASQESYSSKLKGLEDTTSMNIYISNLPLDYDDGKLLELFGDFKVLSHRILKNPDGTSRGVGFARFGSREVAQHVIDIFNNVTLKGAKYPLQVRFADSIAQKKLKNQVATSRKRKDSLREPSFSSSFKKMIDEIDGISTNKNESESEFDKL